MNVQRCRRQYAHLEQRATLIVQDRDGTLCRISRASPLFWAWTVGKHKSCGSTGCRHSQFDGSWKNLVLHQLDPRHNDHQTRIRRLEQWHLDVPRPRPQGNSVQLNPGWEWNPEFMTFYFSLARRISITLIGRPLGQPILPASLNKQQFPYRYTDTITGSPAQSNRVTNTSNGLKLKANLYALRSQLRLSSSAGKFERLTIFGNFRSTLNFDTLAGITRRGTVQRFHATLSRHTMFAKRPLAKRCLPNR